MAYSNHPAEFATAMACIATGRASTESLSKSMIGDHIREVSKRENSSISVIISSILAQLWAL